MDIHRSNQQDMDHASSRLTMVLQEVVARRLAGEDLSDELLMERHRELMPELGDRLGELRRVEAARHRAEHSSEPSTMWGDGRGAGRTATTTFGASDALVGYEVLRELHRGGQGVVYLAHQKSTRRLVAVKVMREGPFAGSRDLARFDREVQILGQLNHPNIVAIHDSGVAGGHHYFVMDFVDGVRLDEWAARFLGRTGAESADSSISPRRIRDVLELFASICDAVNAAHLRGVIHRDLKPGNILICEQVTQTPGHDRGVSAASDGAIATPRILDFGLAKLTDGGFLDEATGGMTVTGQFIGSLPWSSPEQAQGASERVDIRSDVYSLGVILYQVLTGAFPYEVGGNIRDAVDNILRAEPVRPRLVQPVIDDEVETIILKCLNKSAERRYQTAGDLSREIRRYLSGEPIEAKRDSGWYVLRKSLQRHRIAASVAGLFVLVVTISAIALLVMYREQSRLRVVAEGHAKEAGRQSAMALKESDNARREAKKAERTTRFLREMLASVDPNLAQGREVTVRDVLDEASAKVDVELRQEPEVAAAIHRTMGNTYQALGEFVEAEKQHRAAMESSLSTVGEDHADTIAAMNGVATAMESMSKYDEAEALYRRCIELIEQKGKGDGKEHGDGEPMNDPAAMEVYHNLGNLLRNRGKLDEAEPILERVLEASNRVMGPEDSGSLITKKILAAVWMDKGEFEKAEPALREVLEVQRRTLGNKAPLTLGSIQYVGMVLKAMGRLDEAEPYYREAVEISHEVLGDKHPDTLRLMNSLGRQLHGQGKFDEAERVFRETLQTQSETLGKEHFDTLVSTNNLALLLQEQGRLEEAEPLAVLVLETGRRVLSAEHPSVLVWMNNLSNLYARQGRWAEAEPLCRQTLEARQRILGQEHPATLNTMGNLAILLAELDRYEEAVPMSRQAFDLDARILGEKHPDTLLAMSNLARVLQGEGSLDESEEVARRALELRRQAMGDEHPDTLLSKNNLSGILVDQGELEEAEGILRSALETATTKLPKRHWYIPLIHASLGKCLSKSGKYEEAETHLLQGCEGLAGMIGKSHVRTRNCYANLKGLYEAWGKPDRAAEVRAEAGD